MNEDLDFLNPSPVSGPIRLPLALFVLLLVRKLKTFEKILASTVDEGEDYQRLRDKGVKNTQNPLEMGSSWLFSQSASLRI